IELDPKNDDLLVVAGAVHERLGERAEAISTLDEATARRPDDPKAYEELLKIYRANPSQFRDAPRAICETMAERVPSNLEARDLLARLQLSDPAKVEDARAAFEAMRSERPFDSSPLSGLAEVEKAKGNREAMLRLLEDAVTLDPGRFRDALVVAQAADEKSAVATQQRLPDEIARQKGIAAGYYKNVLVFQPDNRLARVRLMEIECDRNHFDEAIKLGRRGLELHPEDAELLDRTGFALYNDGQLRESDDMLRHATDNAPEMALAHYHLGLTLAARKRDSL